MQDKREIEILKAFGITDDILNRTSTVKVMFSADMPMEVTVEFYPEKTENLVDSIRNAMNTDWKNIPPCPFCREKIALDVMKTDASDGFWVKCRHCGSTGPVSASIGRAVFLWGEGQVLNYGWTMRKVEEEDVKPPPVKVRGRRLKK